MIMSDLSMVSIGLTRCIRALRCSRSAPAKRARLPFPPIRNSIFVVIAALTLTLNVPSALSFEGDEHEAMSNAAFALAHSLVLERHPFLAKSLSSPEIRSLRCLPGTSDPCNVQGPNSPLSYGRVTACVDHVGGGPESFVAHLVFESDNGGRPELLRSRMASVCERGLYAILAARANSSHFGNEAIAAFQVAHSAAISLVEQGNDYYKALVTSASADHFLQDFYAPGHIAARRRLLTDSAAVSVHDLANTQGIVYRAVPSEGFLSVHQLVCPATIPSDSDDPFSLSHTRRVVAKTLFRSEHRFERLCESTRANSNIVFRGDGYLMDERSDVQRMYILLSQVTAIVHVLESRVRSSQFAPTAKAAAPLPAIIVPEATFRQGRWDPDCEDVKNCGTDEVIATLHVADSAAEERNDIQSGYRRMGVAPSGKVLGSDDPPILGGSLYTPGDRAVLLGLSLEFSTHAGQSRYGRVVAIGELWLPLPLTKNAWFVVAGALSREKEAYFDYWGTGPEVRLAFGLASLPGVTPSVYYRNIKYGASELAGHLRVEHLGVRVDVGVSDLFGLYMAVHDTTGSYERVVPAFSDWGLSFGITMKIPGLRVLRSLEKHVLR